MLRKWRQYITKAGDVKVYHKNKAPKYEGYHTHKIK